MANQQLALEIVAKDLATATLQKVDAALLAVARSQGTATAAMNRATTSSGDFRAGLTKAGNALENLAGNLIGANNQVANMAEGMLQAFGGGGAVTVVAAGIAAAAAALMYFGKTAREAQAGYDAFLASLTKVSPLAVVGAQIDALSEKLDRPIYKLTLFEAFDRLFNGKADLTQLEQARRIYADIVRSFEQGREAARSRNAVVLPDLETAGAPRAPEAPKRGDITGKLGREPKGPLEIPALRLDGAFTEIIPQVQLAGAVFTDFVTTLEKVGQQMGFIADATTGIGEAFAGLGDIVGGGFGQTAKKLLAPFMKIEGTYFVIKGLAKIADSLFPPNPAGLASGSGMVARGRQLLSLAGGGGTAGGSVSGGGSQARTDTRQAAEARGTLTLVLPRDAYVHSGDPRFQEFLVNTLRQATGRNVVPA